MLLSTFTQVMYLNTILRYFYLPTPLHFGTEILYFLNHYIYLLTLVTHDCAD